MNLKARERLIARFGWAAGLVEDASAVREERSKRADRAPSKLKKYWSEIAPFGRAYDHAEAVNLVVSMVKRYEAALCTIALNSTEERAVAMDALGFTTLDHVKHMKRLRINAGR